ncbi:SMI1 / KNR4 family (SUKH-1) [Marininema mesophilum]|uniref:SMI1 / KNR4 family (SUKH-1) n=1 Tax=Marininema mesophilum TaxID=1048340 RepID=A0A1H2SPB1_9BACL|nr:SMI1/KNR4 family protein [Marininema mesophilum]SDW33347.1 SMI1 / KNR4 family (SUKH-1) [Marininema mesophilum]
MKEGELISKTLQALKSRLNSQKRLQIQQEGGYLEEVACGFNDPATMEELIAFQQKTGWTLPKDYEQFLLLHNGAFLFDDLDLLSLNKIIEYHTDDLPKYVMPIAYYLDSRFVIDTQQYTQGNKDYLVWMDSVLPFEDGTYLNMNFELWLDRLTIAQGEKYWQWKNENPDTFYHYQSLSESQEAEYDEP